MEVAAELFLPTSGKLVLRQVSLGVGLDAGTEAVGVLLRGGALLSRRTWFSFAERPLLLYGLPYFKEDLAVFFWDFLFGSLLILVIPTTFSLMGASDIPAMFRAWQRYSPASLYDIPFRLIMDQRTPTRGDSCMTETH